MAVDLSYARKSQLVEKALDLLEQGATPEEVEERFLYLADLGFEYFQVLFPGINEETLNASQAFAESIIRKIYYHCTNIGMFVFSS